VVHNNLGAALQGQKKLKEAISHCRRALELQPDYAEAYNNLGTALHEEEKLEEAVACFGRALALKPDHAEFHNNLGNSLRSQGKLDDAITSYRRAVELQPGNAVAHTNLGNILKDVGQLEESAACCRRALELEPEHVKAHNILGTALTRLRRFEEALASYDRALRLKPDFPDAHFNLAMLMLLQADFEHGWIEYEWRWKLDQFCKREFPAPRWDGTPLAQRTILLHAEQGLGDTLQFVRYAALVKKQNPAAKVVLECPQQLMKLVATSPGIDRLVVRGNALPPFDVEAPLLSVPGILRTSLESIPAQIPYLFANAALVEMWHRKLAPIGGFRIGINWRGRLMTRERDLPIERFRVLTGVPGAQFISLQKGATREELSAARGNGPPIVELGDDFDNSNGAFMDTAAVMMNLDLVISSDTSVPHLAGALGVPVWLALPYVPDWRFLLDRSDSPWYPTMRLFRQKKPGDWEGVVEEMKSALSERLR
jgi:Flp pilus assembly protein TadD